MPLGGNFISHSGHCKNLAPLYDQLGASSLGENIVIAKMDATTNDIPAEVDLKIEGFPTIVLFKAETNEIIKHDGARTVAGFQAFLKANAKHGADVVVEDDEGEEESEETERDEL
jgi:protein disulfide-isomerase A1